MLSHLRTMWLVFLHLFRKNVTIQYPEQKVKLYPRYKGRIVLTRDPDGGERCVGCYLCSAACPVDCIALQATEDENGRRYPEFFRINFSRCIFSRCDSIVVSRENSSCYYKIVCTVCPVVHCPGIYHLFGSSLHWYHL